MEAVVEQHATEASFLWVLRDQAVRDPHYDLEDLGQLDGRVAKHLHGLRIAGELGWEICREALEDGGSGEAFAATATTLALAELEWFAQLLDVVDAQPELERGVVSALGWLPFELVEPVLSALLAASAPVMLQRIGIAACAIHRRDPGEALALALLHDDAPQRARALRAVGELARKDLLADAKKQLTDADAACQLWSAWSTALAGDDDGIEALWKLGQQGTDISARALSVAVRATDVALATRRVRAISSSPTRARASIRALGMLGNPDTVPDLIEFMRTPALARIAGEAFTMITGASLKNEGLAGRPLGGFYAGPNDDPDDDNVAVDPDENLPWPDHDAVKAWWAARRSKLRGHPRLLLGKPPKLDWLDEVLLVGLQRQRSAAALELAIIAPGGPPFETRAPAFRQAAWLAA